MSYHTRKQSNPDVVASVQLFEKNRRLAFHYGHRMMRYQGLNLDDVAQELLIILWRCCELWDPDRGIPFGAYACKCLSAYCNGYSQKPEAILVSLSEPRGADETLTVADLVDVEYGDEELTLTPGDDRLQARLHDLRHAIETCPSLTDRQRTVLRLFCQGIHQAEIARLLNRAPAVVCTEMRLALAKLSRALGGVKRPQLPHCQISDAWDRTVPVDARSSL